MDILSGCFWLIRRETLSRVGLLDEAFFMYGEDMDWSKRFWLGGSSLAFVSQAEAIHYGGASSSKSPIRFYIEKQRADLQYWKKHHSRIATAGYFLISCLHLLLRHGGIFARSFIPYWRAAQLPVQGEKKLCVFEMVVSESPVTP